MVPTAVATSAGVNRLNRILDQTPQSRVSYVPDLHEDGTPRASNAISASGHSLRPRQAFTKTVQ
eukprot:6047370-Ditylum_brightwellii.AAC.1